MPRPSTESSTTVTPRSATMPITSTAPSTRRAISIDAIYWSTERGQVELPVRIQPVPVFAQQIGQVGSHVEHLVRGAADGHNVGVAHGRPSDGPPEADRPRRGLRLDEGL